MPRAESQPEVLKQIPSPFARLWVGLCIILSIFVVFAIYTTHEVRGLEDLQINVVQKNRKDSLQLLRLQSDAYLLGISMRDMSHGHTRYPIPDWRAGFGRLRADMDDALRLEGLYGVSTPETRVMANDKRAQLRGALADFWQAADRVFALADKGDERGARSLIDGELESKRAVVSEIVSRLLTINDQTQAQAAQRTSAVYGSVKRDILLVVAVLFLMALVTGLYTFEANRKTFAKLHHLAEQLQEHSEELRRLSWKLIEVQEETLRHVARDLHDEFGQILTAIGTMLGRTHRRAASGAPAADPALIQDLQEVQRIVHDTLQTVRDQSQMFRPAILDDFGLEQTLEWFIKQFSRQTGIQVDFDLDLGDVSMLPEEAIHLYRIVQEALNNVARHAKAHEATVVLRESQGELNLEVRDRGVGFQSSAGNGRSPGDGVGLMGMRERAEHLNGSLSIQSAPGEGTVVRVRVPLKSEAKKEVGSRE